jgi:hypothetical protein
MNPFRFLYCPRPILGLILMGSCSLALNLPASRSASGGSSAREARPAVITIQRQMSPFQPGRPAPPPPPERVAPPPQTAPVATPQPEPISLTRGLRQQLAESQSFHAGAAPDEPKGKAVPPFRLMRLQLVNTIESGPEPSPMIGLLTDDFWWEGRLIFPAGTEFHGITRPNRLRDRILSAETWLAVPPRPWLENEPIRPAFRALVLDHEPIGTNQIHFGRGDGAQGIRGEIIEGLSSTELRLFVSAFLEGLTRTAQQREPTGTVLGGTEIAPTLRNAGLSGAAAVMNEYAQQLREELRQEGVFVRITAGKHFYLYTLEPLPFNQPNLP